MLDYIFSRISFSHLNILLLLGLALYGGTMGSHIFQRLKIPQVVGYIAIGIIIGTSGLRIIGKDIITALQPFNYFALGLIGFMIGRELKKDVFVKHGKKLVVVLFMEGVTAFILVTVFVTFVSVFIFKDFKIACALGLLLGAISSATAPAATTDVLWEYKTQGPLTRTVLSIVAMDDGLALLLFAFASSIAFTLTGHPSKNFLQLFLHPVYQIGGSLVIGGLSGWLLIKILKLHTQSEKILALSLGTVLLALGLAQSLNMDMLLSAMTTGIIVVNFAPETSKRIFDLVEDFTPPIYILFFVFVGAKLDVGQMTLPIVFLAAIYLAGRSIGKSLGAVAGSHISGMPKSVQKYLPLCLFSQAGVAIGLSIAASRAFPEEIGNTIIMIITVTTFVVQIIGPPLVKAAIVKAKEVGLNITEEDLIQQTKVKDIMEKVFPSIFENTGLQDILNILSETSYLYYPVLDEGKKFLGVISVDGIRHTFATTNMADLVVAADIMETCEAKIAPESSLLTAKNLMVGRNIEFLPVVGENDKIVGFLEQRSLNKYISLKIIESQENLKHLDGYL